MAKKGASATRTMTRKKIQKGRAKAKKARGKFQSMRDKCCCN